MPNSITWFEQVEEQYKSHAASTKRAFPPSHKYYTVLAALPPEVAESISDVLEDDVNDQSYEKIKQHLIDRHSKSQESRLRQLLSGIEIGDKSPSEYYRHLNKIAGDSATVSKELLKTLWAQRLPTHIQNLLTVISDDDLEKQLSLADKCYENSRSTNISSCSNNRRADTDYDKPQNSAEEKIASLELQVSKLSQQLASINFGNPYRRSRTRSPAMNRNNGAPWSNRRRSRSRHSNSDTCWYHRMYGSKSIKCRRPCKFQNNEHPATSNTKN